jgi:hypothetical protein
VNRKDVKKENKKEELKQNSEVAFQCRVAWLCASTSTNDGIQLK